MLYFLGKLPVPPFEIKNFLPPFCKMGCKYHDIADQLAPKQIINLQTGQHVNRNLQKLLSKDLSQRIQTWDLWKQESIRKPQIGWRQGFWCSGSLLEIGFW